MEFKPNFYDLLLIDVNMPLLDGFQLAQNLVRRDLNVRVCFMTSGEINMARAREVHPLKSIGCFIKKPITTDALIKRIKAELDKSLARALRSLFIYPSFVFPAQIFIHSATSCISLRFTHISSFPATDIYPSTKPLQ